jgi:hypothetical protein
LLLENDGTGHFRNVGPDRSPYFREPRSARGAAVWDYDNDGDLDIIVSHIDLRGTAALLRNEGGNRQHWLGLHLISKQHPAAAVGAKVTLTIGDRRLVRINQWGTTYLSYNDPRVHFGLGAHDHVDELRIRWSDGVEEVYRGVPVDRYLTFVKGETDQ